MKVIKNLVKFGVVTLLSFFFGSFALHAQSDRDVTAAQVDQWMEELSNWGRGGDDDDLGSVNLFSADIRISAT